MHRARTQIKRLFIRTLAPSRTEGLSHGGSVISSACGGAAVLLRLPSTACAWVYPGIGRVYTGCIRGVRAVFTAVLLPFTAVYCTFTPFLSSFTPVLHRLLRARRHTGDVELVEVKRC